MRKTTFYLLLPILFYFIGCNKEDDPKPDAVVSAKAGTEEFRGADISFSNDIGFTVTCKEEVAAIVLGTDWPAAEGTYSLGVRDPFKGKRNFAIYTSSENVDYRTRENSGTLTIKSIKVENNQVTSLKGEFSFTAYNAKGEEIEIKNGKIDY